MNIQQLLPQAPKREKLKLIVIQSLSHFQLCDPTDCSVPGSSVLHYLPEFAQIHVHGVGDAI